MDLAIYAFNILIYFGVFLPVNIATFYLCTANLPNFAYTFASNEVDDISKSFGTIIS